MRTPLLLLGLLLTAAPLGACSVITVQRGAPLSPARRWVLLPISNQGEAPRAGERVEALLATLLRTRGEPAFDVYPALEDPGPLELDDRRRYERLLGWARQTGFDYALTGSVQEWRYRSSPEGEPAVGVTLGIVEVQSGRTLWSVSGARSGIGRSTLAGTAQQLLREMLGKMELKR
jgi:hypothetical protein